MATRIAGQRSTFGESLGLLRTRRFGTFCFASLLSNIGTWAQQIAQPWLMLSIGASSFLIGLDTFALGAPIWMLTLVGGVLADRADRRQPPLRIQPLRRQIELAAVGTEAACSDVGGFGGNQRQ